MSAGQIVSALKEHGASTVVEALRPYVSEARREKIERVLASRLASPMLAIESPSDPHNAAATVRTAEALGVLSVHVIAAEGRAALHAAGTTQGAYHWVNTRHHPDLDGFLAAQEVRPARLFGAVMDGERRLDELPVDGPICLVLGNEQRGLSPQIRERLDGTYRVDMVGMSESLNLSVCAAISLYETTRRRRAYLGRPGDLDPQDLQSLRAHYYSRGLDARLIAGVLARTTG